MTDIDQAALEENAISINEILKGEYNWNHLAFVDGMAPIHYRNNKQIWRPKTKLLKRMFGGSNGRSVEVGTIIKPGTFLKFVIPNEPTQETMDYQNWRGYFDREAVYSEEGSGFVLNRWVRFANFNNRGFQFTVEYLDSPVEAYIPSIVFFGAEWILISNT